MRAQLSVFVLVLVLSVGLWAGCSRPDALVPEPEGAELTSAFPPTIGTAGQPFRPEPSELGALEVVTYGPRGPLESAPHFSIRFSLPIVALGSAEYREAAPLLVANPPFELKTRWEAPDLLTAEPIDVLPVGTPYSLKLAAGLEDATGTRTLADELAWDIETERPALVSVSPWDGELDISPTTPFILTFNGAVAAEEIAKFVSVEVELPQYPTITEVTSATDYVDTPYGPPLPVAVSVHNTTCPGNTELYTLSPEHCVEVQPKAALPLGAFVTLRLASGFVSTEGPLPAELGAESTFTVREPFRLVSATCWDECSPDSTIELQFSHNFKEDSAFETYVSLSPGKLTDRVWSDYSTLSLQPLTKPNTNHAIKIKRGLENDLGDKLGPISLKLHVGEYRPEIYTQGQLTILDSESPHSLIASMSHVKKPKVELALLPNEDVLKTLFTLERSEYEDSVTRFEALPALESVQFEQQLRKNEWNLDELRIPLEKAVAKNQTGSVLYKLSHEGALQPPQYAVVIFTKIALSVIGDGEKAALLVTDLGTASSLRDVTVELRGDDNTTYWTGVTPADGTLELPSRTSFGLDYEEPLWIVAHKGKDQSVLRLSYGGTTTTALAGHLVAERKIYRPGDTLYFKGFPRLLTAEGLRSPAREGSSVAVQLVGVDGEVVSTQTLTLTAHGNFSGEFELPKKSRLGWVSLYARLTDGSVLVDGSLSEQVKVAEFRTPQFEVEVRPIHDEIARGQSLEVFAVGRYLHGAAMSDGKVTLRVDPNRTYHRPQGYNPYQFAPFEEPRTQDSAFTEADLELDARGEVLLKHLVEGQQVCAQRYSIEAEVYDVDRQAVASTSSVLVHPALFYLGSRFIRPEETYSAIVGKPVTAEAIAVGWNDELYAWKDVRNLHLRIEGPAPTEENDPPQMVVDCDPKPVGDSLPTCTVTPDRVGRWLVHATATDSLGNTLLSEADIAVFAESTERHAGQVSTRPPYGLSRDKELYQPGETAKLTLGSADAMVRGIFAVSAGGLRSWHLVDIKDGGFAGTTSKDVPLGVDQLPGLNAEVVLVGARTTYTLMDGYDGGRPALLHDREHLPMDVESQRLSVEVVPSTASARPGDELSVTLVVRARDGLVVPDAEVTLWAVDAGIVLLQPFELPDLLDGLFPRRQPGTWWGETRSFLGYQLGFSTPNEGGGGLGLGSGMGGMGSRGYGVAGGAASGPVAARKKFVTTPYYNGEIITDAEGKATIRFTLPDNLTRFELFAMASEGVTRFGKGKSSVEVSLPLLLRPALPRFANLGDRLEAGVIVQNNSEESVVAQVTASSTGLLTRTAPSATPESVSLEPGRSAEVRFAWLASQTGTETLRFDVATATERDAVEVSLPVQERILEETVAVYGVIEKAIAIPLMLPFAVFADRGGLDLSVSSTRLTGLSDAARYLIDYPHGCLEQTSSRLAPLILLGELGPELTGVSADEVKPMIDAGIERLQSMAMPGGGFSYWPGNGNRTHPFASLYATLILADAQAAGYDTLGLLEPSLNYARTLVLPTTEPSNDTSTEATDQAWIEKAFALYVLASQDALPDEALSGAVEMAKRPVGKPIFARFMLVRALRSIEPSRLPNEDLVGIAEALLISAENQIVEEGRAAHIKEIAGLGRWMDSEYRSDAIALDVLLQVQPEHPMIEKLAIGLLDARQSGRWRSTQENAWALRAMVRYLNVVESAEPNFDMTAWYDGEPMVSHHFEGRSADKIEGHLPITAVIEADGKPVLIGKKGEGRLYYRLGMTYAPQDQNLPAWDAGFSVTREYFVNGVQLVAGTPLNAGDIVKVNITLDCPSRRYYVALVDPLPAAFEPIDTSLATTSGSAVRVVRWSEFNHQELRDNRVEYFADELAAGSHVLQYEARVTSAGQFRAGATVVEEMYTPEVFGRGEPMDLEVR